MGGPVAAALGLLADARGRAVVHSVSAFLSLPGGVAILLPGHAHARARVTRGSHVHNPSKLIHPRARRGSPPAR